MTIRLTFEAYQRGLEEGKLLGLKCNDCGTVTCPPQGVCRACQSRHLEVTELEGLGTLRTFTVVRVAPEGRQGPYVVAMAELSEGPWVMGNLVGLDPDRADMSLMGREVRLASQPVQGDAYAGDSRVLTFKLV